MKRYERISLALALVGAAYLFGRIVPALLSQ
jgi:hypothetical protein